MATAVAEERLSYISTLYKQEDEERDRVDRQLESVLGIPVPEKTQLPFEKVYFNGEMLGKYEPCMDALQAVIDADGEDDDAWKSFEQLFGKFMDFSWSSNWDGKRYDLVVYGCSGYTGYLTMEYLKRVALKRTPEKFTFAFAGRTASKVAAMRDREFKGTPWEDTPILSANFDDPVTMIDLAKSARAIYNVAGPYLLNPGEIMLDACCFAGTHYADINGEIPWCYRMQELDERAKDCGSLIVPSAACAGGDVDVLVSLNCDVLREQYGEEAASACAIWYGGGATAGSSGGTLATRNAMSNSSDFVRKLMADPFALSGFIPARDNNGLKDYSIKAGTGEATCKIRKEDQDSVLSKMQEDKEEGVFLAPHVYAYFDSRICRRTNALRADYLNKPYGREFNFTEYFMVTKKEMAEMQAGGAAGVNAGSGGAAAEKEALEKAGKYYGQGEGPPLEDLADAWTAFFVKVKSTGGHVEKNSMIGNDGYFETGRMAVETCLALIFDYDQLPIKGGVVTTAACCGQAVAKRLVNSGIKFKQGGWHDESEYGPIILT